MIDVTYAKKLNQLIEKYKETRKFEDILSDAYSLNETAFEKTIKYADEYQEWEYYLEQATKQFHHYDIVEIAKILRKEFKKEFGADLKVRIKTKRHWSCDDLYISIKEINPDYLIPLSDFMEDYKEQHFIRYGMPHPYKDDATFERYSKLSIDRIKNEIMEKIKEISNLFVVDNSDIMTDYFERNYMANIKLELNGDSLGGYHLI